MVMVMLRCRSRSAGLVTPLQLQCCSLSLSPTHCSNLGSAEAAPGGAGTIHTSLTRDQICKGCLEMFDDLSKSNLDICLQTLLRGKLRYKAFIQLTLCAIVGKDWVVGRVHLLM